MIIIHKQTKITQTKFIKIKITKHSFIFYPVDLIYICIYAAFYY